jgi:hypothetical protein
MKGLKIVMLVPVWRRPEILLLFLRHLKSNLPDYAELKPVYILSPEDPDIDSLQWLLKKEDVFYYKNNPLGEKMNAGINYIKRYDFDYLMNIGSDNIFTSLLWNLYLPYFERGCKFFGINDFHAMQYLSGEIVLVKNYNTAPDDTPAPIGAGRMIHHSIFPKGDLYRKEWLWGMDGASMFTLWQNGHRPEVVPTNGLPVMLNIMSRTNLTQWEELTGTISCNRIKLRQAFSLDFFSIVEQPKHDLADFNNEVSKNVNECGSRRAAFEKVNEEFRQLTGEVRYKNYDTFKVSVSKHYKR